MEKQGSVEAVECFYGEQSVIEGSPWCSFPPEINQTGQICDASVVGFAFSVAPLTFQVFLVLRTSRVKSSLSRAQPRASA